MRRWAADECVEQGCEKAPLARSLCSAHYQRRKVRGIDLPPIVRVRYAASQTCRLATCEARVAAHGLCASHAARRRRYGLSDDALERLDTSGTCEVCGTDEALHVDHDHATGTVRGVLCRACNTSLGLLQDDPARIAALAGYLERTASLHSTERMTP